MNARTHRRRNCCSPITSHSRRHRDQNPPPKKDTVLRSIGGDALLWRAFLFLIFPRRVLEQVFDQFLEGQTIEEAYAAVARVANRSLDLLFSKGPPTRARWVAGSARAGD